MADGEVETGEQMSEVTGRLQTGVLEGLSREPGDRGREDHDHRHTQTETQTDRGALETQGNTEISKGMATALTHFHFLFQ